MEYRYLTGVPIEKVQQCLQESFTDYQLDISYMTVEVMKHRNTICRNSPEFSVGAFDQNKMVGFLNVGVDYLDNELIAFDGGTGVVKAYRGRGIAGKMLEKSVEAIKQRGINKFMLEVLQPNKAAIKAYEKEGFSVSRNLKCYNMAPADFKGSTRDLKDVKIKKITINELELYWHFIEYPVSWEHMLSGLKSVEKEIIINATFQNDECIGFIVYSPILCWITAIGIKQNYTDKASLVDYLIYNLLNTIQPSRPKISINNLMEEDKLNDILPKLGFENMVDQYEMIAEI